MTNKFDQNMDTWLKAEEDKNAHKRKALENASTVFDDNDAFTMLIMPQI
jgi:hypothetical protein